MLFENFVENVFESGRDCSFDFNGISCQVNEYRDDSENYRTELYYGDKYLCWGRVGGAMFAGGADLSFREIKPFLEEFMNVFGYSFPTTK